MSSHTDEVRQLSGRGFVAIGEKVAERLGVSEGDGLRVIQNDIECSLEVKILNRVAKNCVGFSAGFQEVRGLSAGSLVTLEVDTGWQRSNPEMIASDKVAFQSVLNTGGEANV
jgi:anaerobic selenocysteine-containing dehydrogenase